ncbi:hypothetical protein GALMADRAFT_812094 [Galerina marginata CBS 339.88]|uniref:Uncharacterized protein n=1 Tax=Galerina marginata (strain CBS 339.88) TaxID=685588 RepID=A0A067ST54_GALM3|nr:hypothetical protein GALMADRAFT_812094 [Galerina marginata CBS 339.88]
MKWSVRLVMWIPLPHLRKKYRRSCQLVKYFFLSFGVDIALQYFQLLVTDLSKRINRRHRIESIMIRVSQSSSHNDHRFLLRIHPQPEEHRALILVVETDRRLFRGFCCCFGSRRLWICCGFRKRITSFPEASVPRRDLMIIVHGIRLDHRWRGGGGGYSWYF